MRAEFERHKCTILLYPERKDVWRKNAVPIKDTVEKLAEVISGFEPVIFGCNGKDVPKIFSLKNYDAARLKNIKLKYDDIWVRDTGPIPLNENLFVSFGFDAWSGLCRDYKKDSAVALNIGKLLGVPTNKCGLVLEGGNLTSDGSGTLVAIKETIQKRNNMPLDKIEIELKKALRLNQIIWLERGLIYDETGGHIDNLCAFASPDTVLLAWTDDKTNPQYEIVNEAFTVLSNAKNTDGAPYKIVKVPLPDIFFKSDDDCDGLVAVSGSKIRPVGEPVQASYINFIFANGAVIVPQFDLKQDKDAKEVFCKVFHNRKIVPFFAREVVLGGGGLHCISRNI